MPLMKSVEDYNLLLAFACPYPPTLFILDLVKHYTINFLSNDNDLKMNQRNLWHMFFCGHYGKKSCFLYQRVFLSPIKLFTFKAVVTSLPSLLLANRRGTCLLGNLLLVLIIGP